MAQKRMFNKQIMLSDSFLDMSADARALYVTLNMCADDDGLVNNTKSLVRMCGASKENLEELQANDFIHIFENGVCVIVHWKIHNTIKNDRYKPSILDEKDRLFVNEKKVYEIHCENLDPQGSTDKISIDKLNIEKGEERKENIAFDESKEESARREESAPGNEENDLNDVIIPVDTVKKGYGAYKNVMLTDNELTDWKKECSDWQRYIDLMSNYIKSKGESYADCLAALRNWYLRDRGRQQSPVSPLSEPKTASCSGASYDLSKVIGKDLRKPPVYTPKSRKKEPVKSS